MQLYQCVKSFLTTLEELILRPLEAVDGVEYCPTAGYKTGHTPPVEGWMPFPADGTLTVAEITLWK